MKAGFSSLTPAMSVTVTMQLLIVVVATTEPNPQLEEKLGGSNPPQAADKQALEQYVWQETETISIKGEVKGTMF